MSCFLVPVLGWNDKRERAVIVDSDTGATYEVLEPEGPPIPGTRVDEAEATRRGQSVVDAAAEVALVNTTLLHPALEEASEHPTLREALEAADLMLAGPTRRVHRTDLDPAERHRLGEVHRQLLDVQRRLGSLTSVSLGGIPTEVEALQGLLETTRDWIEELETRELRPRIAAAVDDAVTRRSPFTPMAALGFPPELVEQLQQRELYTLEDIAAQEGGVVLPALERQHLATIDEALTDAGMRRPRWLADRPIEGTRNTTPGPSRSGISQRRTAHIKNALSGEGIGPRSGPGKATSRHGAPGDGSTPKAAKPSLPDAPGYGTLEDLKDAGFGFIQTSDGYRLFVNQTEIASIGCEPFKNMTLHFRRVEPAVPTPAAKGVSLAVPNVCEMSLQQARDLLEGQHFAVVEDTNDRRVWAVDSWSVTRQAPPAGTRCKPGSVVTIHLET